MKKLWCVTIFILIAGIGTGFAFRYNMSDCGISGIRKIEDIQALNCNVNQIFEEEDVELFIEDGRKQFDNLPETVEIYVAVPTGIIRQINFTFFQEVKIAKIIKGELEEEETIEIVTQGGFYDQKYKYHDYSNNRPLYFGMKNILLPESKYLIFVQPLKVNEYTERKRYNLASLLFGTFNLSSDYSQPIDQPANEIPYNEYVGSEYLCDTNNTLEQLLEFKHDIVERYLPETD